MFGTIGHVRLKPGKESALNQLMDEWKQTIRPQIPGSLLELAGTSVSRPGVTVFIALVQDETTYRALAESPDQDAWFRRMLDLAEGDIEWEDVNLDITLQD
jgi:hypothetical protein